MPTMPVQTILAFLIEKREVALLQYRITNSKPKPKLTHPLTQVKVYYESLTMETYGATAPNIVIKQHERRYLDAAP